MNIRIHSLQLVAAGFVTCAIAVLLPEDGNAQTRSESGRDVIDRIVCVVGPDVITASELAGQMQLVALQTGRRPRTEAEVMAFQNEILEQMIADKLFLFEARKDTTIVLRPDEVDQALDDQLASLSQRYGSNEAFVEALAAEGLTLRDLRRQYRDEIENRLLRQRLIQNKLFDVAVSRFEVERFYDVFQDSIPEQPEALRLAHILLEVTPAQVVEDSVREAAAGLRERVLQGADFASLAVQFSQGPSAPGGGDLGFIARDDVVPEFGRAAFNLQPGDISGVVRTQFGYHIIKAEDRQGDRLRVRHILLEVFPSAEDTAQTLSLADSLLTEARGDGDFGELAKIFSTDNETRATGGELGWFALNELPGEFADYLTGYTDPGEIRGPVPSPFGYHIFNLLEYQPPKSLTIADDYDQVRELARQQKTGRIVDELIAELKSKTYIEYRLEG